MGGTLLAGIISRPRARWVVAFSLAALTIILFIDNLRRADERAGRAAERLDQLEISDAIQRQMLDAAARRPLTAANSCLTGCAGESSDTPR